MGFYRKHILPAAIEWACTGRNSMGQRARVIPLASGNVLEIGIGAGHSLSFYDGSKVAHLTAVDPMKDLWKRRKPANGELDFDVTYIKGMAHEIPFPDKTFDTTVVTFALCSIGRIDDSLREVHRVLKPGGRLLLAEHGKAPSKGQERLQNVLNPVWKRIAGGCNLNRDIPRLLQENGFSPEEIHAGYLPGWGPASYNYWGSAKKV